MSTSFGVTLFFEPIRYFIGDLINVARNFFVQKVARLHLWRTLISIKSLMRLSEKYGLKSNFFFMGLTLEGMDSPYAITMWPLLKRVIKHVLDGGHNVGFHPGYLTFNF